MAAQLFSKILKKLDAKNIDDRRLILIVLGFSIVASLFILTFDVGIYIFIRPILIIFIIVEIISLLFAFRNILEPARFIVPAAGFIVVTLLILMGGIHDDALGGYYFLLIFSTLMLGRKGLIIFGFLNTIAIIIIGIAETSGVIVTHFSPLTDPSTVYTTAFFMLAATLTLYFFISRLSQIIEISRSNEQELIKTNRDLNKLKKVLEKRVEDRTLDLQEINKKLNSKLIKITKLQNKLKKEAIRDPLTGLYNRRFLNENLSLIIPRAQRLNFPVTIFFLDIDDFKKFNDLYGHQFGDTILKKIGNIIQSNIRAGDIACRYGGEEFLVVLPGMPKEKAKTSAERIRIQISDLTTAHKENVTISIGIAVYPQDASSIEELIFSADKALYLAKKNGRNRTEFFK